MNQTALITGATSGIGLALAKVFAQNKYNLILVARKQEDLNKTKADLETEYHIQVATIAKDLGDKNAPQEIFDFCQAQNLRVDILVNNAGFGTYGKFAETDLNKQLSLLDLNMRALTQLTGLFLPRMISNKSGKILNTASTAAFQPGPLMAVYYASKAYVLSFTEALHNELKDSGIFVTALCPGATKTNFQNLEKGFNDTRLLKSGNVMSADAVAQIGFDALMQNKAFVIPGFTNKLIAFLTRLGPRGLVTAISRWTLEK